MTEAQGRIRDALARRVGTGSKRLGDKAGQDRS
jgi:hypothetical protein